MSKTPNPVVTRDEYDNAVEVLNAVVLAGTRGLAGITPATLDDDTRVLVITATSPEEDAERPLVIVIDSRIEGGNGTLFDRLTPVAGDVPVVLEDVEESA